MGFEATLNVLDVMLCMCVRTIQFRHAYVIFSKLDHHLSATYPWRIPVKCLSQEHNKWNCRLFHHTIFLMLNIKQESCETFLKSLLYDPDEDQTNTIAFKTDAQTITQAKQSGL